MQPIKDPLCYYLDYRNRQVLEVLGRSPIAMKVAAENFGGADDHIRTVYQIGMPSSLA